MRIPCGDLHLEATLESGQVFGYEKKAAGRYEGVLLGHRTSLSRTESHLVVENGHGGLSAKKVSDYFDLDSDLDGLYSLLRGDPVLERALRAFKGLRLIRQDAWEALACFILSSNNNVKRIQHMHRAICAYYEKRRKDGRGGFPSAEEIARTHDRVLRELGLGYRAPFLWATAMFVSKNPVYLETIARSGYAEARARVSAFPGIGPKVADCALLYGFHRLDAFPVDVWILRAMRKLYFGGRRADEARVHAFAQKRWGAHAGYVQQYIFHAARRGIYEF
jgi:N-glycosylase/DNA lyase